MAVVSVLRSGTSRDPNMVVLLCHLLLIAACQSFVFTACQTAGRDNTIADSLSHYDSHRLPLGQLQYLHHCGPSFHGLTEKIPIYLANGRSLAQRNAEVSVSSSDNIETHQLWARFVIHQSLTTTVVNIVRLSKSTVSLGGELQCAVEIPWSIKWQT